MEFEEKLISRQIIFEGKIFSVAKEKRELTDGSLADREVILPLEGAGILPVDSEKNVYLVRQYRCGAGKVTTEVCSGKIDKGEDPQKAAERELCEELGITADKVISLGGLDPTPAYCGEYTHLYLATGLHFAPPKPDEGEFLEKVKMPLSEAAKQAMDGRITDGKTQIAILKAERMLCGKN